VTFARVKAILDKALADWETENGTPPDMSVHNGGGHPPIGWSTAAELRAAWGKNVQLIQPEVVGNRRGAEANLVIDLKTGLNGRPRMPIGGPFVASPDIQEIIDWIDGGCLDDPVA
jgi:hypothetical protein